MNFSELFQQSLHLCTYSPNGEYIATCSSYRLVIRQSETLQIVRLYTCLDAIQKVEWSSDSSFLLCAMYKRGVVQVWSIDEPDWTCKIDEGSAGLIKAQWSPDGRHVLTTANFNLRITVWSLVSKSVSYIRYIKNSQSCASFSNDNKYLALGENRKCKDYVSIFAVDNWQMLKIFPTNTEDMAGLSWSPDSRVICVWDDKLWYKILIYTIDGRCLATYKAYDWALGVRTVKWSPTSQFLAIGSYDKKVRLLNHITWKAITEFALDYNVNGKNIVFYNEMQKQLSLPNTEEAGESVIPMIFSSQSKYELMDVPIQLQSPQPNVNKPNPKVGISWLAFSSDNNYLATIEESSKNSVFIWSIKKLSLYVVLQQTSPIKCIKWDPLSARLALCTGNDKVYLWSASGAVSVQIPVGPTFNTHSFSWHPEGKSLLLMSKEQMCVCYLENE